MKIAFRKVKSTESMKETISFLKHDVINNGGAASEVVNSFDKLIDLTVSNSPWGPILIKREVSYLEALAIVYNSWEQNVTTIDITETKDP